MDPGYFTLHRKLKDNHLWLSEPFTRGQAWVDMIMLANFADGFIRVRGVMVDVKRGEVAWSENALAERWKWSRGKVRRFLEELEAVQQIVQQKNNVTSLNKIVNYNHYQPELPKTGQQTDSKRYSKGSSLLLKDNKNKEKEKTYTVDFLDFWEAYPNKVGKTACWRKWKTLNGNRPNLETILTAIKNQRKSQKWKSGYIPNPLTWLNQGRWEDETMEVEEDALTRRIKQLEKDERAAAAGGMVS